MFDLQSVVEDLRSEMALAGIPYSGPIEATGKLIRFSADGEKGMASWYVLYTDGVVPAGAFGCWRRGISLDYKYTNGNGNLSKEELAEIRAKMERAKNDRRSAEEKRISEAKSRASQILSSCVPATIDHPYLRAKRVGSFGEIRVASGDFVVSQDWILPIAGCLVVPIRDIEGTLHTLEFIAPDKRFGKEGNKRNKELLFGGDPKAHFYPLADSGSGPVVLCEGYATGASIHEATGWAVYCARNAGNLQPVAAVLRKKFPNRLIIVAADNDRFTTKPDGSPWNPGLDAANAAARSIKAAVVIPEFDENDLSSTDFNDLALKRGLSAVSSILFSICPLSFLAPDSILSLNLPPEKVILGNKVISAGNLCSILAPGGIGKSTLVLQLSAACCAMLDKFLAWDIHPSAYSLRWLIIQAENSIYRVRADLEKVRKLLTEPQWFRFQEQVQILVPLSEKDSMLDLDNPDNLHRLRQSIELFQPDVIVFDALYNFSLRELSKGGEMNAAVSSCMRLAKHQNPNRTPIVTHHALPGSGGALRAVGYERASYGRDSKVLHQLCRSVINIVPVSEESNNQLLVSCGKNNDAPEFHPFVINRNPDTGWFECDSSVSVTDVLESVKKRRPGSSPKKKSKKIDPEKIAALLSKESLEIKQWFALARTKFNISRGSFYEIKDALVEKGVVIESKINEKWCLTNSSQLDLS